MKVKRKKITLLFIGSIGFLVFAGLEIVFHSCDCFAKVKEGQALFKLDTGIELTPGSKVLFGNKQARIVKSTKNILIVDVPPSDFEGINWSTTVSVKIVGESGSSVNFATWTYSATNPPTKVANIGVLWLTSIEEVAMKVVKLFVDRLGPDWRFQFFLFPNVFDFYASQPLIQQLIDEGRLELVWHKETDRHGYSVECMNTSYWENIHGDRVLIFQTDSVPCSGAEHDITDFFDFDYVGGTWKARRKYGGNGGLSLRNRTALMRLLSENKKIIKNLTINPRWVAEDVLICLFTINTTIHFYTFCWTI